MCHHDYWSPYEGPQLCVNPAIRRNKKGQPKSTKIRTNIDERERCQPTRCSICRLVGHSKNRCPTVLEVQVKQINFFYYQCISFHIVHKLIKHSSTIQFNSNVDL